MKELVDKLIYPESKRCRPIITLNHSTIIILKYSFISILFLSCISLFLQYIYYDLWMFNTPQFLYMTLMLITSIIGYQFLSNKLSIGIRTRITIRKKQTKSIKPLFPFITHILSFAFVLWMSIWVIIAGMNENYTVINHFNVYGEYHIELILVLCSVVVITIGLIQHYLSLIK